VHESVKITRLDSGNQSPYADRGKLKDLGNYARDNLPENAVLFLESNSSIDYLFLMFYSDRSSYRITTTYSDDIVRYARYSTGNSFESSINIVKEKGGISYLVSTDAYSFPLIYKSSVAPYFSIYKLPDPAFAKLPKRNEQILYFPFEEGSGNTINDMSGNENIGIIHGAKWVKGKFGNALAFDGKDDYVEIPYKKSLNVADGITISAWVMGNTFSDQNRTIINASETRNGPYLLQTVNNGIVEMGLELSPGWICIQSGTGLTEGQFWHVAATYDRTSANMRMYINGQLQNTSPLNGKPEDLINLLLNEKLTIGKNQGSNFFNGIIDELHIYRQALTAEEIQQLYRGR
jgi:hypothetical protein